jgi:hypothetical protein
MASAIFSLEDTKEARAEISLLLQIEPSQLDRISHNGYLTVEFPNLLEDKALHVLSGAVANHGFVVSINHTPVKKAPSPEPQPKAEVARKATLDVDKLISKTKGQEPANKGKL